MSPRIWITVDAEALMHNYRAVQEMVGSGTTVVAVVKANGYGHGIAEAAAAFVSAGAPILAVSFAAEASALRDAGIDRRLLLLTPPRGKDAELAVSLGCQCCVMDRRGVEELARTSASLGVRTPVHLKVDTGMGRLGADPGEAAELAKLVLAAPELELAAVFSHCSCGWDRESAAEQVRSFRSVVDSLQAEGIDPPVKHIAASAAALTLPLARLDAVRIGTLLYGQFPNADLGREYSSRLELRNTWECRTRIIAVRDIPRGRSVGYGAEFSTQRNSRIAVIAAGVADGLGVSRDSLQRRSVRNIGRMLLRGNRELVCRVRGCAVPVVGRIATQMASIDVTGVPGVEIGDEVVLPVARLLAADSIPRVLGSV